MDLDNLYVWDIETCMDSEEERKKPIKMQVHRCWLSGIYSVNDDREVSIDTTIEGAFKSMCNLTYTSDKDVTLFAHNAIFDMSYLKHLLLKLGYEQYEPSYDSEGNDVNEPLEKQFLITETEQHQFYCAKIWLTGMRKKNRPYCVNIVDSLKKIPLSVKAIGESWELPTLKGEIDYEYIRPLDHIPTIQELDYLKNDCVIVTQVLRMLYLDGYSEMTISSSAYQDWKNTFFNKEGLEKWATNKSKEIEETNKDLPKGKKKKKLSKNVVNDIIEKKYRELLPVLDTKVDDDIRKSYKGGITYASPKYKGKNMRLQGKCYDVNSLYPSVMYNTALPYGEPKKYKGNYKSDKLYNLYIQKVYIAKAKLKNPNSFPFIQIKDKNACKGEVYKSTEYLSEFSKVELWLTSIELEYFLKHYDVYGINYIEGYKFMSKTNMFNGYIDKWIEVKKKSKGGKRQFAKLMLNSLYGKFASNPRRCTLRNIMNENGIVQNNEVIENHMVAPNYTAIASFITSYARRVLINAVYSLPYDNFYYCDTDSIHYYHLDGEGEEIEVDQTLFPIDFKDSGDLGLWKLECTFSDAKYLGAKKYMEYYPNKNGDMQWDVKCCGLPSSCREQITSKDMFHYGAKFDDKLQRSNGIGGIRLTKGTFSIKEITLNY